MCSVYKKIQFGTTNISSHYCRLFQRTNGNMSVVGEPTIFFEGHNILSWCYFKEIFFPGSHPVSSHPTIRIQQATEKISWCEVEIQYRQYGLRRRCANSKYSQSASKTANILFTFLYIRWAEEHIYSCLTDIIAMSSIYLPLSDQNFIFCYLYVMFVISTLLNMIGLIFLLKYLPLNQAIIRNYLIVIQVLYLNYT